MPITAQCPGCGQTLQVGDEFAGVQANCPRCATPVTFGAPGQSVAPPAAYPPQPPAADPYGAAYAAAPAVPRDNTLLFDLIGVGGAGFALLLLILGIFLRWAPGLSGFMLGDGRMLLCLCLLLAALLGVSFRSRRVLAVAMVACVAAGAYFFFVVLALISGGARGAGVWIALVGMIGLLGASIPTAIRCPMTVEAAPGGATFLHRFGALLIAAGAAAFLGLIYLVMTLI